VQGTVTLTEVHVASLELGEVCDEMRRRVALARDEALRPRDELGIGEASERSENIVLHVRVVARVSDTLRTRAQRREHRTSDEKNSREAVARRTNA